MTFDVTSYVKFINMKCEAYMADIFRQLTINNPKWVEDLKNDVSLFKEDGTPLSAEEMGKEKIDEKIKSIMEDVNFTEYVGDRETISKLFVVTEDDVKKFIIE